MSVDLGSGARAGPGRPPRRGLSPLVALALVALALGLGIVVGYAARGGPPPPRLLTVEREVPVVTVRIEQPATTSP